MRAFLSLCSSPLLLLACGGGDVDPDALPGVDAMVDAAPGPVPVAMHDVSVLFPIPTTDAEASALRLDFAANGGPLLTPAVFAELTPFATVSSDRLAYANWRVVGARIDPCFPTLAFLTTDPSACRPQLRLIAQAFGPDDNTSVYGALDSSIHLLYDLPAAEFDAFAAAWIDAGGPGARDGSLALGPHPRLAQEGMDGAMATELKGLIAANAGPATLRQVTAMEGAGVVWTFAGVRVDGGTVTPLPIGGVAAGFTQTIGNLHDGSPFSVDPVTTISTGLEPLSGEVAGGEGPDPLVFTATAAELQAALTHSLLIDDPTGPHHADNIDCVSCHTAGRARARAATYDISAAGLPRYQNPRHNLRLEPELTSIQAQRAFGYLRREANLNQRVVNESAEVADLMATRLGR